MLKLEESQAAAAVGQIALAGAWSEELGRHGLKSGQILLTLGDTEERRRYLNARATISTLLKMKAVPVINENDTVATSEIRYGDNDRLAARVATMMGADLLVLLSDIDGLYTAPPALDPRREVHPGRRAHHARDRGDGGCGGLRAVARRHAHQARRRQDRHRRRHRDDHHRPAPASIRWRRSSAASAPPSSGRAATRCKGYKTWIAGQLEPAGRLTVDAGAVGALLSGKSLLPAGVKRVSGNFARGDTVAILSIRTAARSRAGWLPTMPPMP